MSTLFSEIQALFERTYAGIGVNLEDCLIDRHRSRQLSRLAGARCAELSEMARTFLRAADGRLRVGIFYSGRLIDQLERHDPRAGLSDANIRPLIAFIEEINHAVHAALQFQRGGVPPSRDEDYARNLELQGLVDTYLVLVFFVAFFRRPRGVTRRDRRWLRFHLLGSQTPGSYRDGRLSQRYSETLLLASTYITFLEGLAADRRVAEVRNFHTLDYQGKRARILGLRGTAKGGRSDHSVSMDSPLVSSASPNGKTAAAAGL